MALIATGSISKALMPGVNAFVGTKYNELPMQFDQIFDTHQSTKNFEEDVQMYGLGLAVKKPEGTSVSYDEFGQGWVTRYVNVTYGLGFIITREAIEDNQYQELAAKRATLIGYSMRQTKEVIAANVLNRAFSSSYVGGDGIELSSSVHLMAKGGTFRNELATPADLSELALEQAIINLMNMTDDAGNHIAILPTRLIVPTALWAEAARILKSPLQNDSANNAINAIMTQGMLPGGFVVNNYLTDTDAFFIKTNAPEGLKHFNRRALTVDNDTDFDSDNMKFKATERYSFGWSDPRGIFCSEGA